MARYYLDLILTDGHVFDSEGVLCSDDEEARKRATENLRQMTGECLRSGEVIDVGGVRIRAADDRLVGNVNLISAISPYLLPAFTIARAVRRG